MMRARGLDIWDDGTPADGPAGPRAAGEISGSGDQHTSDASVGSQVARPYVGILFRCCGVYARVYRDATGRGYSGACPRCASPVRLKIGTGGTSVRFFEAG